MPLGVSIVPGRPKRIVIVKAPTKVETIIWVIRIIGVVIWIIVRSVIPSGFGPEMKELGGYYGIANFGFSDLERFIAHYLPHHCYVPPTSVDRWVQIAGVVG